MNVPFTAPPVDLGTSALHSQRRCDSSAFSSEHLRVQMDAARHRDELEELTRTNVRLRVDEGEALQKVAELEGKIRDSEREAEERCEAVRGDANAVEEELESLRARHSAALKEAEGMQEEHQKVLCQVQDLEQQEQLLQADVNRAKAAASAYEAKIAELRQDKLQLEKVNARPPHLPWNVVSGLAPAGPRRAWAVHQIPLWRGLQCTTGRPHSS